MSRARASPPTARIVAVLAVLGLVDLLGADAFAPQAADAKRLRPRKLNFRCSLGRSFQRVDLVSARIRFVQEPPGSYKSDIVNVTTRQVFRVKGMPPGITFRVEIHDVVLRLRDTRREVVLDGAAVKCAGGTLAYRQNPAHPLVFERRRGSGTIPLRVVRKDGKPVEDAFVRVYGASFRGRLEDPVTYAFTGPDGRATARGLLPGDYLVRLVHAGSWAQAGSRGAAAEGERYPSREVTIPERGRSPETVRFDLEAAGVILARVDRGPYLPAHKAKLTLRKLEADGAWRTWDDPALHWNGEGFSLGALVPGRYELRLLEPGYSAPAEIVEVQRDRTAVCTLRLGRALPEFRVQYDGPAANRFEISRYDVYGGTATGPIRDAPVVPKLYNVLPGRYVALLWGRNLAQTVDLPPGPDGLVKLAPPEDGVARDGERSLRIRFGAAGGDLRGLLIGIAPYERESLQAGRWLRITRAFRGECEFTHVPPGSYDLYVFDNALGTTFGFGPGPLRRTLLVEDEDVTLEFNIAAAVRAAANR